jgi:PhnB protein
MHANIQIGNSAVLLSDGRCQGKQKMDGYSLSLTVQSETDANRIFAALSDGGKVQMPQTKTFFSPRFGMVADPFGVLWMVIVQ